MRHAGGVRIDHVLGLTRLWLVPEGARDRRRLSPVPARRPAAADRAGVASPPCGHDRRRPRHGAPALRERLSAAGIAGMDVLWFQREDGLFVAPTQWAASRRDDHPPMTCRRWPAGGRGGTSDWRLSSAARGPRERQRSERAHDREALLRAFRHGRRPAGRAAAPDAGGRCRGRALSRARRRHWRSCRWKTCRCGRAAQSARHRRPAPELAAAACRKPSELLDKPAGARALDSLRERAADGRRARHRAPATAQGFHARRRGAASRVLRARWASATSTCRRS